MRRRNPRRTAQTRCRLHTLRGLPNDFREVWTMMLQIDFRTLVWLFMLLVIGIWALIKWLMSQFEKRLDERFATQEESRKNAQAHWEARFKNLEDIARETESSLIVIKSDMSHKVNMIDYVRNQSIIESKLDALWTEMKVMQAKGGFDGYR
jgi:hypothetical protein